MKAITSFFIPTILVATWHLFLIQSCAADEHRDADSSPLMMLSHDSHGKSRRELRRDRATRTAEARRNAEIAERQSAEDRAENDREDLNRLAPSQDELTLQHFRAALEANPEAERLVIFTHQNGMCSIESRAVDPTAFGRNRDENMQVINILRNLISQGIADDLLKYNNSAVMAINVDPLSASRLRAILERASVVEMIGQPVPTETVEEKEREEKLIIDLEKVVQEATQRVAQTRQQLAQEPSNHRNALLLSVRQAEAALIRAKADQTHNIVFLEFQTLGEAERGDRIKEFGVHIQTARSKATSSMNEEEASAWGDVTSCLKKSSQHFVYLIDSFALQNKELAKEYAKIVDESQKMATYQRKIAQAHGAGATAANKQELPALQAAALAVERGIDHLTKGVICLEKKQRATLARDQELADQWNEVALTYQRAAKSDIVSAQMHEKGHGVAARRFGWGGEKADWGASWHINRAAENLEKSTSALERLRMVEATGDNEIADALRETIPLYQQAAQHCNLAAEYYTVGRRSESVTWHQAGKSLQLKADYWVKVAEANEAGKLALADGYHQAVVTLEAVADLLKRSAEAEAVGKKSEGNSLYWASRSLQSKADYEIKVAGAVEAGKRALVTAYRQAATASQAASDLWRRSASASAVGKRSSESNSLEWAGKLHLWKRSASVHVASERSSESDSWAWAGKSLQLGAGYLAKAAEADSEGKEILGRGYREAVVAARDASDLWRRSAEAHAARRTDESISWNWAGWSLRLRADYLAKAAEADSEGKEVLGRGYREAAAAAQDTSDLWKRSAEAHASGKTSEGISWEWAGTSLQSRVDYELKAVKANREGKEALASGYREAAVISQAASDLWKGFVETKAAVIGIEGLRFFSAGESLQARADYLAKVAEAHSEGKEALASGYREAAAISQATSDLYKRSTEAMVAGRERESDSLYWAGWSLQVRANYLAKAAEADTVGEEALGRSYREAAAISQDASDLWKQSATAKVGTDWSLWSNDYERLRKAGEARQKAAYEIIQQAEREARKSV